MKENDIISTLDLLNFYLGKRNENRTFIICGGASLILQHISNRATRDVDIISPKIDKVLKEASEEVAKSLGLDLVDLYPTNDEIDRAAELTKILDGNPNWPSYVENQKLKLNKKMGHE